MLLATSLAIAARRQAGKPLSSYFVYAERYIFLTSH